jgi:pyroglutamyl-peptidase
VKTVLVTGFDPFDGQRVNPSALAVRALAGREIHDRRVRCHVLPVEFGTAVEAVMRAIADEQPELVICVGEAGGRAEISVERVAINIDDARIPDNAGAQPIDRPVVAGGPAAYWSTLPIKAIVAELERHDIAAAVSQTAGTFVCNHVFYAVMHALAPRPDVRAGFIHVPQLPEQATRKQPSMPLEVIVRGLELAIATALTVHQDVRIGGGATH